MEPELGWVLVSLCQGQINTEVFAEEAPGCLDPHLGPVCPLLTHQGRKSPKRLPLQTCGLETARDVSSSEGKKFPDSIRIHPPSAEAVTGGRVPDFQGGVSARRGPAVGFPLADRRCFLDAI